MRGSTKQSTRILLVEDDRRLGPLLARALGASGYRVELAARVEDAKGVHSSEFDLAIVDWMLPDGDGLSVCAHLRREDFDGPILMLTARGEVKDRVHALDLAADDYLTKPFEMEELLARLRALLRRSPQIAVLESGPLHIDIGRRNAFIEERLLLLTEREFDLLTYLVRRKGDAVSKAELVQNVWYADEVVGGVVEVYVSRLRDKLGVHAPLVETVRGTGYRFRDGVV